MKKLFCFIIITLLLCCLNCNFTKSLNKLDIFNNSNFEVFTTRKTNLDCNKIENGQGEILFLDYENFISIYSNNSYISGFNIYTNLTPKTILKKLNAYNVIIHNQSLYAYSPIINSILKDKKINNIKIDNKEVNMQINIQNNKNIVGFPINLGSF